MTYIRSITGHRLPPILYVPTPPALPSTFRSMRDLTAPVLDRLADAELQHGHHARAEALSRLADEIREGTR